MTDGQANAPDLSRFLMTISKASFDEKTGQRKFLATASDTDLDSYGEAMSLELFSDFIKRAVTHEPVPVTFRSEFWEGGMPYLSVSHYPDLNGVAVPGEVTSLYMDGNRLKAKGIFYDTPLGIAAFNAVKSSLKSDYSGDPVRISIGFLDWKHRHGDYVFNRMSLVDMCPMCRAKAGSKVYLSGHLIHLALTRVPVNRRTDIQADVEVTKSMAIKTRLEDAASIVGEELAQDIEEQMKITGKSEVVEDAVLVERAEEEEVIEEKSEPALEEKCESAEMSLPFGGATTFKQVDEYHEAQETQYKMYEMWGTFINLVGNVLKSSEVEDKSAALGDLVGEMKSRMEMKSLALLESLEGRLDAIEKSMVERSTVEVKLVEDTEHPLYAPMMQLRSAYDAAKVSDLPLEERFVEIQNSLNILGEVIRDTVSVPDQPQNETVTEEVQHDNLDVETLKSALTGALVEAIQPLTQKLDLLVQTNSAASGVNISRTDVPQRRSVLPTSPALTQLSVVKKTEDNPTPKLRDIISRSVYGNGYVG